MPAEQPNPHGKTLDTLRAALVELLAAARQDSNDATLMLSIGHVGAAVAILATRSSSHREDEGSPAT
jgi:hypothetical protein